jgi:nucleoside-diphosphate-sugar epimerase
MAILITGGAGFIGLNLIEELSTLGETLIILSPSDLPSKFQQVFAQKNISYEYVQGRVDHEEDLQQLFDQYKISKIIHAAAITADQDREINHTKEILETNLMGSVNMFEYALRYSVDQLIQLSSGSIFGNVGTYDPLIDEVTSPVLPETVYGISKLAAERLAIRYRKTRGLNVTTVRLGLGYGRWEYDTGHRDTLSLPLQVYWSAIRGESIVLHESGGTDYIYGTDIAKGLALILAKGHSPEPLYHLSSGNTWSLEFWLHNLQRLYPAFQYRFTKEIDECTIGQNGPLPRSPMSIKRIQKDFSFQADYLGKKAFDDFILHQEFLRSMN